MHPRWPHGTAAARSRIPARSPLPRPPARPASRPPFRAPRPGPGTPRPDARGSAPAPRGPGPGRRWSAAGQIVLLAAVAALLAGCGHSAAPAAAKAVSHPAVSCGSTKTPANVPVKIEVAKGKVACPDAMAVERAYTTAVAQGRAPGNGRGPVQVSGWRCQAFTTPVSLKTGDLSACHRSGAEILAVLLP
jgi:hypothetical protein